MVTHRPVRRHDLRRPCSRVDFDVEPDSRLVENSVMYICQDPAPPTTTESGRPQALELRHRNIGENDLEPAGN